MDANFSTMTMPKTMPVQNLLRYISFKMVYSQNSVPPNISAGSVWAKSLWAQSWTTSIIARDGGKSENLGWLVALRRAVAAAAVFWSAKILGVERGAYALLLPPSLIATVCMYRICTGYIQGRLRRQLCTGGPPLMLFSPLPQVFLAYVRVIGGFSHQ